MQAPNPFGTFLRDRLDKMNMSIRKLARECGYDPATISRLINGRQKPRPDHMVKIARILCVPAIELWQAAGFIEHQEEPSGPSRGPRGTTSQSNEIDMGFFSLQSLESLDIARIIAELEKYRLYAQTDEGHGLILQEFDKKINQIKAVGPCIDKLQNMYRLYRDNRVGPEQRQIIGSVLLYFILPTDIIPDYVFPTGYLDDAVAIDIVWGQIQAKSTDE